MDCIEEIHKQANERGYYHFDMKEIELAIERDKIEWIRKFDDYILNIINQREGDFIPSNVIEKARKLADLRKEVIEERFK